MSQSRPDPIVSSSAGMSGAIADIHVFSQGEKLDDRFQLLEMLAEGGMGTVWRGRDESLDASVAIKILRHDLVLRPALIQRMIDEARAAARLDHPAIVRVLDVRRHGSGIPFIVMELLEGQTLAEAMESRRNVAAERAARCLLPVAGALTFAHEEHGIIHRDVKPENVVLAESASGALQPKLVDFGMAKAVFGGSTTITGIGTALGTPRYMSPEQAQGCVATPAVDIWAYCVVLYELIAGFAPFEADSLAVLINRICSQEPEPLTQVQGVDQDLWAIIARGLAKQSGDRWPTMRKLGEALACWLLARGVTHDVSGKPIADEWAPPGRSRRAAFDSDPPPAPEEAAWREHVERISLTPFSALPHAPVTPPTPRAPQPNTDPIPESTETPPASRRRSRWTEADNAVAAAQLPKPAAGKSMFRPDGSTAQAWRPLTRAADWAVTTEPSRQDGKSDDPAIAVRRALEGAEAAYAQNKVERAYELAAQAIDGATTVEAEQQIGSNWKGLSLILFAGLGGKNARIEVGSLWGWSLSPAEAYVASRIGGLTVGEAIDATGIDERTALRTIYWLHRLGLVKTG